MRHSLWSCAFVEIPNLLSCLSICLLHRSPLPYAHLEPVSPSNWLGFFQTYLVIFTPFPPGECKITTTCPIRKETRPRRWSNNGTTKSHKHIRMNTLIITEKQQRAMPPTPSQRETLQHIPITLWRAQLPPFHPCNGVLSSKRFSPQPPKYLTAHRLLVPLADRKESFALLMFAGRCNVERQWV